MTYLIIGVVVAIGGLLLWYKIKQILKRLPWRGWMRFDVLNILGIKRDNEEDSDEEGVDTRVNIHTMYKHRWVWYHLILCIQMILTNILLIGILITMAIKLWIGKQLLHIFSCLFLDVRWCMCY